MTRDRAGTGTLDPTPIRRRILADHRETVQAVVAAADEVAADWDEGAATERSAVSGPLRRAIERRKLGEPLLATLRTAVRAAGRELTADPVAAPPYLVVNGRGPLCRATVDGGRILVAVAVFGVERAPVRYVRTGDSPESVLEVTVR